MVAVNCEVKVRSADAQRPEDLGGLNGTILYFHVGGMDYMVVRGNHVINITKDSLEVEYYKYRLK